MSKARLLQVARVVVLLAIAISAYTHLRLASDYDHPAGGSFTQGTLFKVQAVVALLIAITLAIRANINGWANATLLLLGSFAAVLFYRYGNLGQFLFLPDMRDKTWSSRDNLKVISTFAEGGGGLIALAALIDTVRGKVKTAR